MRLPETVDFPVQLSPGVPSRLISSQPLRFFHVIRMTLLRTLQAPASPPEEVAVPSLLSAITEVQPGFETDHFPIIAAEPAEGYRLMSAGGVLGMIACGPQVTPLGKV